MNGNKKYHLKGQRFYVFLHKLSVYICSAKITVTFFFSLAGTYLHKNCLYRFKRRFTIKKKTETLKIEIEWKKKKFENMKARMNE